MKKKIPDWIFVDGPNALCARCGKREVIPLPMPIDAFTPWCQYFGSLHQSCVEPRQNEPKTAVK